MAPPQLASERNYRFFTWALLGTLVAIGYLGYRVQALERELQPIDSGLPKRPVVTPRGDLSEAERAVTELFAHASGSVVHITTLDLQADPFRLTILEVPRGTGSGFVWDDKGHIVTNMHVIASARTARVTLEDHSEWPAELVGVSPRHDLAVLHVAGVISRAAPLPIGTSSDLLVGQQVAAIGSPFGLDYTLSTGVISGLGREIPGPQDLPIRGVIQTDAAINPGNSGGPLLDSAGRLIGVNTAIFSPSGASAGIGFAISVDTVAQIVPELIRYGKEVRPVIGVELVNDALTHRLGLAGALIANVTPGSAAAKAGLRGARRDGETGRLFLGDLILAFGDAQIGSARDLYEALDKHRPGDEVEVRILREGEETRITLKLGANVEP